MCVSDDDDDDDIESDGDGDSDAPDVADDDAADADSADGMYFRENFPEMCPRFCPPDDKGIYTRTHTDSKAPSVRQPPTHTPHQRAYLLHH